MILLGRLFLCWFLNFSGGCLLNRFVHFAFMGFSIDHHPLGGDPFTWQVIGLITHTLHEVWFIFG